jgi:hypothetical protein
MGSRQPGTGTDSRKNTLGKVRVSLDLHPQSVERKRQLPCLVCKFNQIFLSGEQVIRSRGLRFADQTIHN